MNKYKVLSLSLLFAVAGAMPLQAATESKEDTKNLQSITSSSDAAPSNSSQTDPENDSLANEAGKDFSEGGKGIGRGFVKGAKVTGSAFKTAGTTMGRGFKRAGVAIRNYFAGKPEVEERDLSGETEAMPTTERDSNAEALDAVGNDAPKAESKRLSKESSAKTSEIN